MTDGAGSTTPGTPYKMKFIDKCNNVGKFFNYFIGYVYKQLL